jgi:hypothetical protein
MGGRQTKPTDRITVTCYRCKILVAWPPGVATKLEKEKRKRGEKKRKRKGVLQ